MLSEIKASQIHVLAEKLNPLFAPKRKKPPCKELRTESIRRRYAQQRQRRSRRHWSTGQDHAENLGVVQRGERQPQQAVGLRASPALTAIGAAKW